MKQKSLVIAVIVLLVMNVVTVIGWSKSMNQVDKYHYYYKSTEALLDTLENEYNWIDARDSGEPCKYLTNCIVDWTEAIVSGAEIYY